MEFYDIQPRSKTSNFPLFVVGGNESKSHGCWVPETNCRSKQGEFWTFIETQEPGRTDTI